uniref:Arpin n=1 Tax=Paramoeba aestuarina TaxID=180227 RepID=A0A7S4NRC2_9EUKA|mmetsp:Transcript_23554/g.36730  ORF Transcript_23554/g.36730 Transcript_23554/m.36730 type:complete len:224 (+) Transcript_23554:60-731(+)|eukprot:CAMPEP_0201522482 /NCGR_PEP_ID=MMETSP0161_2-20130828/17624_1 /ASSEMBLY_ACC=CAM_ASM_000251 /TAXON_ID=180227 /ORGANISM="Neoparamoeba aestuarina, Strain SoJaBio B1-5/56/2" /LENGTH=223 /DNA_ID=CAMNT_0047921335 /DNA_START=60 /DNA_END=731 /DNA_ORIENTATION=+
MAARKREESTSTSWNGHFKEEEHIKGNGLCGEGVVQKVRFHSVQCRQDVTRYIALNIKVHYVYKKVFDKDGLEEKPRIHGINQLRKDYPNYTPSHKNDPVCVSPSSLIDLIGEGGKPISSKFYGDSLPLLHPKVERVFEFWGDNNKVKSMNLQPGDEIVFSTKGDSIFLDDCHIGKGSNVSGANESQQKVLGGFGAKINELGPPPEVLPWELNEGCDDDEWSD